MTYNKRLVKGIYKHNQISGYLSVRQYMVINQNGKRCLILRFENEMAKAVNAVEFSVKRLDADGNLIGDTTVKYDDLSIAPGQFYAPEIGTVIEKECADFIIQMRYVICQKVKYVFRKGMVTAHYNTRGYSEHNCYATEPHSVTVKRKFSTGVGFFRCMALLAFVLAVAALSVAF